MTGLCVSRLAVLSCLIFVEGFAAASESKECVALEERLALIESQAKTGGDLAKLEAELLAMAQQSWPPEEKGKIYATAAAIYAARSPITQPNKLKAYATKALEYPLDLLHKTLMYVDLSIAQVATYDSVAPMEYLKHRAEIAEPCLRGLKLLLDNKVPAERVPVPGVGKFDVSPSSPDYQRVWKEHEAQMAARAKAQSLNELVRWRIWLTGNIVAMYSLGADGTQELKELAKDILKDDRVVGELLTRVKAEREKWQGGVRR